MPCLPVASGSVRPRCRAHARGSTRNEAFTGRLPQLRARRDRPHFTDKARVVTRWRKLGSVDYW